MKLEKKNYIFIGLGIVILLIGILGTTSESIQLLFVSIDKSGLTPIGTLINKEGSLKRKLVNDVLWFPISTGEKIYLGDSLSVSKESFGEVEFSHAEKGKLKISSDTVVKMRMADKKPMITLEKGELDFSGDVNSSVYVNSGLRVQSIQIRKNSNSRVKRTEDGDLEVKTYRTDLHNEQGMAEIGQSKDKWVRSGSVEPEGGESEEKNEWIARPLKYPYPADNLAFLVMNDGTLGIFPKAHCEVQCQLKILNVKGDELLSKAFKTGEEVVIAVQYKKHTAMDLRWILNDGGNVINGTFIIRPYSNTEMKKLMKDGRPMEVITGL